MGKLMWSWIEGFLITTAIAVVLIAIISQPDIQAVVFKFFGVN